MEKHARGTVGVRLVRKGLAGGGARQLAGDRLHQRRTPAGVYYPGERSAAVAADRAEQGIPVAPKVWRELTERAERLGVTLPTAAAQRTAAVPR
ncbi:hypothetical protein [Streptomyces sp. PSKA30]|uniref:hypothetical protein n=1 Tax=Streptomyces sp. PSKA30 TaxID=2874597 RepID=UPI001CD18281|nr:hypothetical protein [Streptomyces sp. PSKA30]MBZ9644787.1 hypothetical protein [Streptomyces sp. PSKA30]